MSITSLPFFVKDEIVLFADDTFLIFKTDRRDVNYDIVIDTSLKVVYWFNSNDPLLNAKKKSVLNFNYLI